MLFCHFERLFVPFREQPGRLEWLFFLAVQMGHERDETTQLYVDVCMFGVVILVGGGCVITANVCAGDVMVVV